MLARSAVTAARIPDGWDEAVLALRGLHRVEAQARIAIGDEAFDEAAADTSNVPSDQLLAG